MRCIERYSICVDQNRCTDQGGQEALGREILSLDLYPAQFVTAQRMMYMISSGNTYSSINRIGPDALRFWSSVLNFIFPATPKNRWKIEVEGWFETTLARWRLLIVEFATNTADLDQYGHAGFPISNSTLDPVWKKQCASQKISNIVDSLGKDIYW
jgi:hypothetical protein